MSSIYVRVYSIVGIINSIGTWNLVIGVEIRTSVGTILAVGIEIQSAV